MSFCSAVSSLGSVVEHAERAERQPFGAFEQRAGIEPQVRLTGDQRIAREALVTKSVRHDEQTRLQDRVGADRHVEGVSRTLNPISDLNHWRPASTKLMAAIGASQTAATSLVMSSKNGSRGVSRTP